MDNSQQDTLKQIDHYVRQHIPTIHSRLQYEKNECYLQLYLQNQLCKIFFYNREKEPYAGFYVDDNLLFDVQLSDKELLVKVLKRWICDCASPSQMQADFPWLHTATLTDYYERNQSVESLFMESWNSLGQFCHEKYVRSKCNTDLLQAMINNMREAGFDRLLRAGTTLLSMGLSRSRRHGLREGQACIWFEFCNSTMNVHAHFAKTILKQHPIIFTPNIEQLLVKLTEYNVD
ncbi:hypothetical protein [Candidatus Uabimicrobium sp. HlEnr_7]|uniref:hypothetical protein n=1 Tax=Candidatus Uabimicrobium helgolandensis TaxID=3095367 RepID=UPI00355669CE